MTDDTKERRKAAGVGKGANMAVGYQWRNVDVSSSRYCCKMNTHISSKYVAFLRFLTLRNMKDLDEDEEVETGGASTTQDNAAATTSEERPTKRRRAVTWPKHLHKKVFDAATAKLMDRPPSSASAKSGFALAFLAFLASS